MAPPKKLTFNFSSEAAPNNYIRGPITGRRRKQERVLENAAVVVDDDDDSPLFEPLADQSPDRTEVSHHSRLTRPVSCTHQRVVRQETPQPVNTNEARMSLTNANVSIQLSTYL